MAKLKETDKRDVRLGMKDVSNEVHMALYSLQNIHNDGMALGKISELVALITAECGEDAVFNIETSYSDYYGSDTNCEIHWSRKETDEEVEKRIASNAKKRKTAAETRKKAKIKKVADEKAELKRLTAKYPDLNEED